MTGQLAGTCLVLAITTMSACGGRSELDAGSGDSQAAKSSGGHLGLSGGTGGKSVTVIGGKSGIGGTSSSGGTRAAGGSIATGGVATGGVATGGVATGGVATGGVATGGVATGGVATGGVATGGVATGGVATGGVATGGVATGGVAGSSGASGGVAGSAGAGLSVVGLALGGDHTCALLSSSAVRCWGQAIAGALGYGNLNSIGDDDTPAVAGDVDVGARIRAISCGTTQTCVVTEGQTVRCWGSNQWGELGYGSLGSIGDTETPASVGDVDLGDLALDIAAGHAHTCALLPGGRVRCWGYGGDGRLGYGNQESIGDNEAPGSAGDVDVGGRVVQLAAGGEHTCALLDTGGVRCWGAPRLLGYGDQQAVGALKTPAVAGDIELGGKAIQITAGSQHTCALLATGAVRCWGSGVLGCLGYGNVTPIGDNEPPAAAGDVAIGGIVVAIAAGGLHTCALLATAKVRCWGDGRRGQLGYANTNAIGDNETPASAGDLDLGGSVVQLAVGRAHACVLLTTGKVRCWGWGNNGKLGYANVFDIGDGEFPSSAGDVVVF